MAGTPNSAPAKSDEERAREVATKLVAKFGKELLVAAEKVRGSLKPSRGNAVASVEFYLAALTLAGIDPASLSFDEIVVVTNRLYSLSASYRETARETGASEREAAENAEKAAKLSKARAKFVAETAPKRVDAAIKAGIPIVGTRAEAIAALVKTYDAEIAKLG